MDSINDVLNAAKQYCREHTSEATYQYYISDIKAVSFENSNTITLEIRNAFILSIVSDRYATTLKDAFKSVLGFDVDLKFVTPKEGGDEEGKEKKPKLDEKSLPSGRYDFTFENFIKGPIEPVCLCGGAGGCGQPVRRVQPAVHLRAIRPGQDPLAERDPGGDQKRITRISTLCMWTVKCSPMRSSPPSRRPPRSSSGTSTARRTYC